MSDFEVCPVGTQARLAQVEAERDSMREILDHIPQIEAELEETSDRLHAVEAERDALKQTLHDELDGNLRLRELGGARPDEPFTTFMERVIAERDALLAALSAMGICPMPNQPGRWLSAHRPGLNFPSAEAAAIDAARGGGNG